MITIATSQYRYPPRSCHSSTGHGAPCPERHLGPLSKTRLPINVPPFGLYLLLGHYIVTDQGVRSTRRNSNTAPAAPKSP